MVKIFGDLDHTINITIRLIGLRNEVPDHLRDGFANPNMIHILPWQTRPLPVKQNSTTKSYSHSQGLRNDLTMMLSSIAHSWNTNT